MHPKNGISPNEVIAQRDAFIERFLGYAAGAFNIFAIYIGDRLGLYRALAEGEPATSAELAAAVGANERYIREWLEQQTIAGIVELAQNGSEPTARRFRLPPGHVEPLIDCDSLNYMAPMAQLIAGAVRPLSDLVSAYRTGAGVPFEAYGEDLRQGQAAINYPAFAHQLVAEWLPAMPDVHQRLMADPPARIADVGCGHGWSSIAMARGYPNVRVDGFDLDQSSIEQARINARTNRVADRVTFQARDAGDPALVGRYDLVTAFECVHDMSRPVEVLSAMRRLAGPTGAVLVMDERVGDAFTTTGNDVEWMMYGWSVLHCLPVGMVGEQPAGTGTVMRTDTLRRYALDAGFSDMEVLPIEHFFFRFYHLRP
jgi:SAM-dependent methyltransferase